MNQQNKAKVQYNSTRLLTLLMAFLITFAGIGFSGICVSTAYAEDAVRWQDVKNNSGTRVYFIGTNENGSGGSSLAGANEIMFKTQFPLTVLTPKDGDITPPQKYVDQNGNVNRRLRGWYLVPKANEYTEGQKLSELTYVKAGDPITLTADMKSTEGPILFYADWEVINYNFGSEDDRALGGLRENVVHTESIRTDLYDIEGTIYNLLHAYRGASSTDFQDNGSGALFVDSTARGAVDPKNRKQITNDAGELVNLNAWTGKGGAASQGIWGYVEGSGIFDGSTPGVTFVGSANNGPMFWKDENPNSKYNGYFVYNSEESAAVYNKEDERFYVYNKPQYIKHQKYQSQGKPTTAFLPFNAAEDNKTKYDAYEGNVNYHFGMVTQVDFFLTGKVGDPNANKINVDGEEKDMIFYFSGDDDVYVFVDGKLALDIGGVHDRTAGTINFRTGEVTTRKTSGVNGTWSTTEVTNNESIAGLGAGNHKLTIYYMERGADESNNLTAFLLTVPATIKLQKLETQTGEVAVFPGAKFYLQNDKGQFYSLEADVNPDDPLSVPKVSYVDDVSKATVFEAGEDGMVTMRYIQDGEYRLTEIGAPDYYNGLPGSFKFKVENAKITYNSLQFSADNNYTNPDQPFTETADWMDHVEINDDEVTLEVSNDRKTKPLKMTKAFKDKKSPKGVKFSLYEVKSVPLDEDGKTLDREKVKEVVDQDIPEDARLVYEGTTNAEGLVTDYTWYPLGKDNTPKDKIEKGKEYPDLKEGALYYIVEEPYDGEENYYTMEKPIIIAVDENGVYLVSDPKDSKFVFENVEAINFYEESNDNPAELDVTNVPITIEEPIKKVNGNAQLKEGSNKEWDGTTEALAERNSEFTYTITQKIPAKTTKVVITDVLKPELEIVGIPTISPNPNNIFEVSVNGTKVTATADGKGEVLNDLVDKEVTLTIKAKINDDVTDVDLIKKYGENYDNLNVVPNKASVKINDKPEVDSNEVVVTPPPTEEKPVKKVNGQTEKVSLKNRTEEFTYTVTQYIPANSDSFTFKDELKPELVIVEKSINATGAKDESEGNTVQFTLENAKPFRGKEVTLTIKAKIKEGVTDAELIEKYGKERDYENVVPNQAEVTINVGNKPSTKSTNEVLVTPPPTEEDPEKKVNDKEKVALEGRDEKFTYTVTQKVPANATTVTFEDTLEDVLEVVSAEMVGANANYTVTVTPEEPADGVTQVVKAVCADAKTDRGNTVTLTIVAKIKDGVTDAELINKYGSTSVPNKAKVTINDKGNPTNEVTVTPPTDPEKKVNNQAHVDLENREEEFTYKVVQTVPAGATKAYFEDDLEDVLEVKKATIDPAIAEVVVDGNKVTADATGTEENPIVKKDTIVTLTIKANIKADVTDAQLIEKYGTTTVPNKAKVTINDKDKTTNEVTVTPPSDPEKTVNDAAHADLENRDEVFTYKVTQTLPAGATNAYFEDVLEDVLVVEEATIDPAITEVVIDGNKVSAEAKGTEEKPIVEKDTIVTLTIKAKIKADVTDAQLLEKYGTTTVPNKAKVAINGKDKTTNEVTVTPPDEPEEDPVKKVNGVDHVDLDNRQEEFTYTVTQKIPTKANTAEFEDVLEDVLEVVDAKITKGDANYVVNVAGNKVTAVCADVKVDRAKEVELTIVAKLRSDVTDEQLIAKYGSTKVPNEATVKIGDNPKTTNTVTVTPPDSPREDPEKEINGQKELVELESRPETFTYTVSQAIPEGAKKVVFEDTLEDVLEIVDDPSINCEEAVVSVDGNKVIATIDDASSYAGETLTLTIVAKISDSVDDAQLIAKYGSTTIPNKAVVTINDIPRTTNEVKVVPPVEDKEIVKTVNDAQHADLESADEVFTYDVEVYVPADAEKMTITDKLVDELQFNTAADEVSVTVDGEEIKATKTIDGQLLTVEVVTSKSKAEADETNSDAEDAAAAAAEKAAEAQAKADELEAAAKEAEAAADEARAAADAAGTEDANNAEELEAAAQAAEAAAAEARAAADAAAEEAEAASKEAEDAKAAADAAASESEEAEEEIVDLRAKTIKITFKASIKEGADLTKYLDPNGNPRVPNTANYIVNDDPDRSYDSNTVTVTPPTPPADEPEKFINGEKGKLVLTDRADTFVYTITQQMPYNAISAVFEDQVEDVLDVVSVKIDGDSEYVNETKGNLVRFITKDASADRNKKVTMTITAKLRDGITDVELIDKYGTTNVPNKATVAINGNPQATNEVLVTPPKPEELEPVKKVNGKDKVSLSNRDEIFTYTVSQKIPAGSKSAEFEDVLENVLEPIEATINVDGVKPVIKGQTVTANIKDARSCAGKIVVMTIKARIKSSATDAELDAYTNLEIPNIATVAVDGVAKLTNEVFVTPPTVKPSYDPDEPTKKTPDKETVVKGSKKVNTGDGVGVIPFIFMLISATAIAGLMFIRRMRKES